MSESARRTTGHRPVACPRDVTRFRQPASSMETTTKKVDPELPVNRPVCRTLARSMARSRTAGLGR